MSHVSVTENYIWSIHDQIGEGAMGKVYKCCSKQTGHQYAAKVFNYRAEKRPTEKKMREFEILKKSCHPNIVQLIGLEICMRLHCNVLIMELCSTSMLDVIELPENGYGLTEKDFTEVLNDICLGMEYLREKNIVHRDVKPGNILRTEKQNGRYVYKLSDFGAARELTESDENQFFSICGTEEYLHPDIYEKGVMDKPTPAVFSSAVDLWSFGVTVYHLATGSLPFKPVKGREDKQTMFQMINKKNHGVISVHQDPITMDLIYLSELPDNICLSKSLRHLLTPLLKGLIERNPKNAISHEFAFKRIKQILSMQVIDVYSTQTSLVDKLYIQRNESYKEFKNVLKRDLDFEVSNDTKFVWNGKEAAADENNKLDFILRPESSSPLIILDNKMEKSEQLPEIDEQLRFPRVIEDKTYQGDHHFAKKYAKVAFVLQREATKLLRSTEMILKSHDYLQSKTFQRLEEKRKSFRDKKVYLSHKQSVLLRNKDLSRKISGEIGSEVEQENVNKFQLTFNQLIELFGKLNEVFINVLENKKLQDGWNSSTLTIQKNDLWLDSIKADADSINKIYDQFYRYRKNPPSTFEDIYRKGEREKMRVTSENILKNLSAITTYRNSLHDALASWMTELHRYEDQLDVLENEIRSEEEIFEENYEAEVSAFEKSIMQNFKSLDAQFDWLVENTPELLSITSSHYEKLSEILRVVDGSP